jgi:hypothetical protein
VPREKLAARVKNLMEGLEQSVTALGLSAPPVAIDESFQPFTNPLELCRTHLASILARIVQCSQDDAHKSIQWPNNIFNGDLAVVLPKLKPGIKVDKLAVEIMEKVLLLHTTAVKNTAATVQVLTFASFPKNTPCFAYHSWMECISAFCYIRKR